MKIEVQGHKPGFVKKPGLWSMIFRILILFSCEPGNEITSRATTAIGADDPEDLTSMLVAALGYTIGAVFFDAVGTILHPDPSAVDVYYEVGRKYSSRLNREIIRRRFADAFGRQEEADRVQDWATSEDREIDRWRTIVSEVLDDVSDPAACFAELWEHFAWPASWRLADDAAETLDRLHEQGCILGLASNFDRRLCRVVAGFPGLARLGPVVISSEVGWRKPSPQFFAALSRVTGLPADQILLVGDDIANDYLSAAANGMPAVLYDPEGRWSHSRKYRRMSRLIELFQ
jgi:putative hydrolase of the HAD superfamily